MTDAGINGELYPNTFWLSEKDEERLDRIAKRYDITTSKVISEALEFLELCLYASDDIKVKDFEDAE